MNETNNKPVSEKVKKFQIAKVAILGRPNAGKSTLLNALLESELSGTSSRPQTTRRNIKGVIQRYTGRKWTGQIVLVDTPGMNFQKGALERSFYNSVEEGLSEADVVVWVADAKSFEKDLLDLEMGKIQDDRVANWLAQEIKQSPQNWVLALSKVDKLEKNALLPLIERALTIIPGFKEVVPLAAIKGLADTESNLKNLLKVLDQYSVDGEALFEQKSFTDISSRELIREFVREAVFRLTMKEVPYETECQVLGYKEAEKKKKPEIDAVLWVSRPSLKGILVGNKGQKIKEIGMTARARYEEVTGEEVILRLHVKVVDGWERRMDLLGELGYNQNAVSRSQKSL